MATSRSEIMAWLNRGKAQDASHVVVVCDTFDYDDFPVFCSSRDEAVKINDEYEKKEGYRVMEVYDLSLSIPDQMAERRAFHL